METVSTSKVPEVLRGASGSNWIRPDTPLAFPLMASS